MQAVYKSTYSAERCSFSELAPKGHAALVLVSRSLVEGVAVAEGRAVEMQGDAAVGMARVLHPMKTDFVWRQNIH